MVYCARKRADISSEDFHNYWLGQHASLYRQFADTYGAKKYIQSHTIATQTNDNFVQMRGFQPPYDGITEIWFDSLETFLAASSSPEGKAANQVLAADEAKFIDISRSCVFLTEEHTLIEFAD